MKKFCLTFLMYPLFCLYPELSFGLTRVTILNSCVVTMHNDSLVNHPKSKLTLFLDYLAYDGGSSGKSGASVNFDYLLINNTNDTLRYCHDPRSSSQFFLTADTNIIISDNRSPLHNTSQPLVILPHGGIVGLFLTLKLKKAPDTTFNFKFGVHLVKWSGNNGKSDINQLPAQDSDTVWSDVEEIKTDSRHRSDNPTREELDAWSLKRPLWSFFPKLTVEEKQKYTLSIDQNKIPKLKDTIISRPDIKKRKTVTQHYLFTKFPVTFTNTSNDTLQYINMDCSREQLYKTNDTAFNISDLTICYKNEPAVFKVLPKQSFTVYVPIETRVAVKRHQKIKIGMSIQKYVGYDQLLLFGSNEERIVSEPELSNMIWSNEVEVQ